MRHLDMHGSNMRGAKTPRPVWLLPVLMLAAASASCSDRLKTTIENPAGLHAVCAVQRHLPVLHGVGRGGRQA